MEPLLLTFLFSTFLALMVQMNRLDSKLKRLDHRLSLILQHLNLDSGVEMQLSERVQTLARDPNRKIEAIKVHRQETGAGLKESKQAIEAFLNS